MKTFFMACTALSVLIAAVPAGAQDIDPSRFNGFSAGGSLTYSGSDADVSTDYENELESSNSELPVPPDFPFGPLARAVETSSLFTSFDESGTFDDGSFGGGAFVGYDRQIGPTVFGAIVDFDYYGQGEDDDFRFQNEFFGKSDTLDYSYGVDWAASARARVGGLLTPNDLLFLSAGISLAQVGVAERIETDDGGGLTITSTSSNETVFGGVFGLGYEHAFDRNVLLRVEGLHYRFEKISIGEGDIQPAMNTVKASIGYRF